MVFPFSITAVMTIMTVFPYGVLTADISRIILYDINDVHRGVNVLL